MATTTAAKKGRPAVVAKDAQLVQARIPAKDHARLTRDASKRGISLAALAREILTGKPAPEKKNGAKPVAKKRTRTKK